MGGYDPLRSKIWTRDATLPVLEVPFSGVACSETGDVFLPAWFEERELESRCGSVMAPLIPDAASVRWPDSYVLTFVMHNFSSLNSSVLPFAVTCSWPEVLCCSRS